ncbi:MAG: DUF433 domain-containing protein [Pyrinomonadaceae bacterium MAG19_C2-C3]|nr:DUF433 domain-containing protein [Pyrinomonadaceae bacterium MAG19_C2-C3]
MMSVEETEQAIANLSRAEKARLLQWIARDVGDAFPGIETTQGVMGGAACIRSTRISVWMLEEARRLGISEANLLHNYPGLTARDLRTLGIMCAHTGRKSKPTLKLINVSST